MTKLILYGTFRKAALDYAARGWPVFPLKPGGRTPVTAHGLDDATTNAHKIDAWWARWPAANIGLDCERAGLVVIDVDAAKGGLATWAALDLSARTLTAQTGSGFHFIYTLPAKQKPVRSKGCRLGPGVVVRAAGEYIVLPPSVLANGRAYEWLAFNDGRGGARAVLVLPPTLLALLPAARQAPQWRPHRFSNPVMSGLVRTRRVAAVSVPRAGRWRRRRFQKNL